MDWLPLRDLLDEVARVARLAPGPRTVALLGLALIGFGGLAWRRRRRLRLQGGR